MYVLYVFVSEGIRIRFFLKSLVCEIYVKRIRVSQGVGVLNFQFKTIYDFTKNIFEKLGNEIEKTSHVQA